MMRIATLIVLGAFAFVLGCNTVEGVGKDIRKAGETIEDAATKKK
jgi:predicted small secreted protein